MNFFKGSTQFKNWMYNNKNELDRLQVSKFERGLKILAELNRDLQSQAHPTHTTHTASHNYTQPAQSIQPVNKETKPYAQPQPQPQPQKVSVNLKSIHLISNFQR